LIRSLIVVSGLSGSGKSIALKVPIEKPPSR